jgi:hypothetical protein
MGFQSTIQTVVGRAFNTIGDLKESVDYIHEGDEPDYNPVTGAVSSDPDTVTLTVRAVFKAISDGALPNTFPADLVEVARPGDWMAFIPGVDMTIPPTTGDKIVRQDETWVVKAFSIDPAGGLWRMVVKRTGGGADGALVFHE